jgi:adenylate cyclase
MKRSEQAVSKQPASAGPVPDDVRKAVALIRRSLCSPLPMCDLAAHCGVAERTLNAHFRMFIGVSPIAYLRRLRLAAAREALLCGRSGTSVTEVARRYLFEHAGRFSGQYRRRFGEPPSSTLRRAQAAARAGAARFGEDAMASRDGGEAAACPAVATREKPAIVILLGAAPTNDSALRWFVEAVAEAIAADLSSFRALAVMLPTSVLAAARHPQRLSREMGAGYFLTGRIVCDGTRLRLVLRVADAATGHHVWGDSFDGDVDRLLALQDRIVRGVRRGVAAGIRGAEIDRASRRALRDLDAHGLTMRALPWLHASTAEGARRALEILERAIEVDPDYGVATALAAWGHGQLVMYNGTPAPAVERKRSRDLALRAAILDDDDPLALTARCAVHMMLGELDTSEPLAARALAGDPASAWAWGRSGWLHAYRGSPDSAIAHFRHALRLDPVSSRGNICAGIGAAHFDAGRYAAAACWTSRAMREQPGITWANRSLAVSYARLGERTGSLAALDRLRRSHPDLTVGRVVAAVPFRRDFLDRLGDGLSALGLPP